MIRQRRERARMNRLIDVLRKDWPDLLLQVLVLILGISISFWLNEWRMSVRDRAVEVRTLQDIRDNLIADSTVLATQAARLAGMTVAYDALLDPARVAALPPDSVDVYMDLAISYTMFPHTVTAYEEMKQTGASKLFRNTVLLNQIIHLYTAIYSRAGEWDEINRRFVLDRMIPYLDDHAPYVEGGYDGGIFTGMHQIYGHLAQEDRFRNLLRTNRLFKEAQRAVYQSTLQQVRATIAAIDRELPR